MDLSLTEDQQTVTDLFDSFFANECNGEFVRETEPLGHTKSCGASSSKWAWCRWAYPLVREVAVYLSSI